MPRPQVRLIPAAQLESAYGPILAEARARIGDTTTLQALANHEPLLQWYFRDFYERVFYGAGGGMTLDARTKELLRLRLSKQRGCLFCNRWNTGAALAAGISQAQVDALLASDPQGFDAKDQAVIALADQMLLHNHDGQLDASLYDRLRNFFDDAAIIELGVIAAVLTGFAKFMFVYDLVDREEACPLGPAVSADHTPPPGH